jgi:glycosyltransferase involved in cell wall biosynthesis
VAAAYGADHVHAVHHGVDLDLFRPGLHSPIPSPYVLFVGVLHPRKNLDALKQSMAGLPEHRLVVVGSTPADRPDSRALVEAAFTQIDGDRLDRIDNPTDAELAALYAGAAAFALPSFFEGFGLPALEAMACGAPVVVSNRGALPEVVGGGGVVVEPTAEAVEAGLREAIADAARLREAARAQAERFTWERTVDGWLAVIREAVTERRG